MEYIIYSDTHFYGVYDELVSHSTLIKECTSSKNVLCLGDIYDKTNCSKKNANKLRNAFYRLQNYLHLLYLTGNHDSILYEQNITKKLDNVLACHGHHIFYSKKKQLKWTLKPVGSSKFRRKFMKAFTKARDKFDYDWYIKLKLKRYKKKIVGELIKYDCDTIVMGHLHPKKVIDIKWGGKRVVAVPRGRTEVNL